MTQRKIKCRLETWKNGWSGVICREGGRFWDFPDAQKEIRKRRKKLLGNRLKLNKSEIRKKLLKLTEAKQKLKEKIEKAKSLEEFKALQKLADELEQEARQEQDLIDDFIHKIKKERANTKLEAYRAANDLREALRAKQAFRDAEKAFADIETIKPPAFIPDDVEIPKPKNKKPDSPSGSKKRKPTNNSNSGRQKPQQKPNPNNKPPGFNAPNNKRPKPKPKVEPIVPNDYPINKAFKSVPGINPRTKRELSAAFDLIRKGGKSAERGAEMLDGILGKLPSRTLKALANPFAQLGFEIGITNRNLKRMEKQGAGKYEKFLGILGRYFGVGLEEVTGVPDPIQMLPVGESGGEILGRGIGRGLDKTGIGQAGEDLAVKGAKGLDNLFGNFNKGFEKIDISKPRKKSRFEEINDENAPERKCVGIQCLAREFY